MAALDREVAEEKAEVAELEINKLTEKISELEMEVAVLQEENGEDLAVCNRGTSADISDSRV
jgi:dynactin 1